MSDEASPVFGIDLGTTYSCIAYVDEFGRATVVTNSAGDRTTPSVVQFIGDERIVGKEAKNISAVYPGTTQSLIKRQMGGTYYFDFEGVQYGPEEISSFILRKVVSDAEQNTGKKIKDVVITCPAYFGIPERNATQKAGEIAGLNVLGILNEPTAAAIAYGMNTSEDQTVLVYDLGGGTFDVTIIRIESGKIRVVCTDGNHRLGGTDWDFMVASYFSQMWQEQMGLSDDPMVSDETRADLMLKAELAKLRLTAVGNSPTGNARSAIVHNAQRANVEITREKFDELTVELLAQTVELTHQALREAANRGFKTIDKLLLVGGSTKMPQVAERLRREFNLEPQSFEPDESVAKGAALFGQSIRLKNKIEELIDPTASPQEQAKQRIDAEVAVAQETGMKLPAVQQATQSEIINVSSRSFGVIAISGATGREMISNLILRNTPVPAHVTEQFSTYEDQQASADIRVVDNLMSDKELSNLADARVIGSAEIVFARPLPANSPIEITFTLNEGGLLLMNALELTTGRSASVELKTDGGMTEEAEIAAKERGRHLTTS